MDSADVFSIQKQLLDGYDDKNNYDGISGERLAYRLHEIAKIGLTSNQGSNRPGFSQEEKQVKELVKKWMKDLGLIVRKDGAGNIFGFLEGENKHGPTIMSGSHVDTVPNGGHFDGVLGVVAALEVVEAWREKNYIPEKSFEIAVFTDEEGTRFNGGFSGSEAMIGIKNINDKLSLKDTEGKGFSEVLEEVGLNVEGYSQAKRDLKEVELFVELHIEQGKTLEKENLPCGVVTGIAGPCWLEITFHGEADHAGNTPMGDRADALVAASAFVLEVSRLPREVSDSAVATIGRQLVEPNGINVIPGTVTLYVDIRDIFKDTRDELIEKIIQSASHISEKHNVSFKWTEKSRTSPVPIQEQYLRKFEESIVDKGIKPFRLPSGAGHDAMVVGEKIPIAMLFIRSKAGISHNPAEWSDLNDCVQGVHVLKDFIEHL